MTKGPRITRKEFKEDKVYLTMAEVVDYAIRYRLQIGLAVLAIIAVAAMFYFMSERSGRISTEASWALYQANDIEDSTEKAAALEKVVEDYRGTQAARFAEFALANSLYGEARYEEALEAFQEFLKRNSNHLLAPSAAEAVGYCRESLGRWNEAIETYEAMIRDNPAGPLAARANYRLGHCHEKLDEREKAIEHYEKAAELAPGSLWATYADQQLKSLDPEKYASNIAEQPMPGMTMPFTPPPAPPVR